MGHDIAIVTMED